MKKVIYVDVMRVPQPGMRKPAGILLRFLRSLKERELMFRFKASKTEHDKGKKAELREKRQKVVEDRPDFVQRQKERREIRERERLLKRYVQAGGDIHGT